MSQVIPSHVLRVGQTVCVSSQGSKSLQPPGCPSCSTLPRDYGYYSPPSWPSSAPLLQPSPRLRGAQPTAAVQGKGQQETSLERPSTLGQPREEEEEEPSTDPEAHLVSPTLDISIEKLNQLILEIDPTFQPFTCQPGKDVLQSAPQGDAAATRGHLPEARDIQHTEMSPGRAPAPELLRGSPSPLATALSRSLQGSSSLPQNGTVLRTSCSPSGSVGLSSSPRATSPQPGTPSPVASPSCSRAAGCVAAALQSTAGQTDSISYGPGAASSNSEKLLKPVHVVRAQQRSSSLLSTSPGSDTSYVLGSTHSLPRDDLDAQPAACCSLGSPCLPSPGTSSPSAEAFGLSAQQPRACSSSQASSCLLQKGQASSCPPSLLSCTADIPVLLVNGCLQQGEAASRLPQAPPASAKQELPASCSQALGLGGLSTALSAPALSWASDSPLRAGQPTMKFVMDTSKYWFKPSLSRDQAIQLLQEQEPGTFVVRDSTSYRGAFGLALRVPAPPASSPAGGESSDLVRHFLIESSAKGVRLKGASEELYFGSLSAFVYQHAITPLALPCRLSIPTRDLAGGEESPACAPESALASQRRAAVCNVLYLSSVNVETLTGAPAIQKATSCTLESLPTATLVHFRVTEQGVTLTDIQRRLFFRRHYPLAAIRFCGLDPENRKWQKYCKSSRIFGFVAKSQTELENLCHLFAEYDTVQPATPVIQLLCRLLPAP